jgi:hypothetical protein
VLPNLYNKSRLRTTSILTINKDSGGGQSDEKNEEEDLTTFGENWHDNDEVF